MSFCIVLILLFTFIIGMVFGVILERYVVITIDDEPINEETTEDKGLQLKRYVATAVSKILGNPYRTASFLFNDKSFKLYKGEFNRCTQVVVTIDGTYFRSVDFSEGFDSICKFIEGCINDYFNREYMEDTKHWEY